MPTDAISAFPVPTCRAARRRARAHPEPCRRSRASSQHLPALSWRPDEFRAFMAYHDALMNKREGLTAPSAR
jgi:hypothetical protein